MVTYCDGLESDINSYANQNFLEGQNIRHNRQHMRTRSSVSDESSDPGEFIDRSKCMICKGHYDFGAEKLTCNVCEKKAAHRAVCTRITRGKLFSHYTWRQPRWEISNFTLSRT